jgi:hypothetical protein
LPISDRASIEERNWFKRRLSIRNENGPETPNRGQSALCPDRLFTKSGSSSSIFLGVTPAPQYSLNLATNNSSVKQAFVDCQLPIADFYFAERLS